MREHLARETEKERSVSVTERSLLMIHQETESNSCATLPASLRFRCASLCRSRSQFFKSGVPFVYNGCKLVGFRLGADRILSDHVFDCLQTFHECFCISGPFFLLVSHLFLDLLGSGFKILPVILKAGQCSIDRICCILVRL